MKGLDYYTIEIPFDTLVQNIDNVFSRATVVQSAKGASWYHNANQYAKMIADETGTPLNIVSMVIAALSPNNRWVFSLETGNLGDAIRLIQAHKAGLGFDDVKVSTYNPNKRKAFDILDDADHDDPSYYEQKFFANSPKTWNFANNIQNPQSNDYVTIDGHATHVAVTDEKRTLKDAKRVTHAKDRYNTLVRAYRTVADKYGLKAWQVQAITWTVYTES